MSVTGIKDEQLQAKGWWLQWANRELEAIEDPKQRARAEMQQFSAAGGWLAAVEHLSRMGDVFGSRNSVRLLMVEKWHASGEPGWRTEANKALDIASDENTKTAVPSIDYSIDYTKMPTGTSGSNAKQKMRHMPQGLKMAITNTASVLKTAVKLGDDLFARECARRLLALVEQQEPEDQGACAAIMYACAAIGDEELTARWVEKTEQVRRDAPIPASMTSLAYSVADLAMAYHAAGRHAEASSTADAFAAIHEEIESNLGPGDRSWTSPTLFMMNRTLGRQEHDPLQMPASYARFQATADCASAALDRGDRARFDELSAQLRGDFDLVSGSPQHGQAIARAAGLFARAGEQSIAADLITHARSLEDGKGLIAGSLVIACVLNGDLRQGAELCEQIPDANERHLSIMAVLGTATFTT